MHLFLTSSPCTRGAPEGVDLPCILEEANGFVELLAQRWPEKARCLIVCADPEAFTANDEMMDTFYRAFRYHELPLADMALCDGRNEVDAEALVRGSDVILLSGGHVPTENAFFSRICLRELLEGFDGILIGISAGTMNCADTVYAQPELEGEADDPDYQRFIPGLGLTDINVLPHYQMVRDNILDGQRLFEDITFGDSFGNCFFALPDGSFFLIEDGETWLFGEAYQISDGEIEQICADGEELRLE
ncbi:MAG: Type 1 glutamine amidotransferase-like domain-containing protein [Clostridiales bacterium]|nr:Type 1 glutamine amidotransferase-like domain-containing protein [Clostridiales bacterium]